jgi:hypothetical protein
MRVGLEQTDTESLAMIFAMFSFAEWEFFYYAKWLSALQTTT